MFTTHRANIPTGNVGKGCSRNMARTYPREMSARNVHNTSRKHTQWKGPPEMLTKRGATNAHRACPQEMFAKHGARNTHRKCSQGGFTTQCAKHTDRKCSQEILTTHSANRPKGALRGSMCAIRCSLICMGVPTARRTVLLIDVH
jgi:hypothetical protein